MERNVKTFLVIQLNTKFESVSGPGILLQFSFVGVVSYSKRLKTNPLTELSVHLG